MIEELAVLFSFLFTIYLGYIIARVKDYMDNELPTRREIKRRIKQPRPRC